MVIVAALESVTVIVRVMVVSAESEVVMSAWELLLVVSSAGALVEVVSSTLLVEETMTASVLLTESAVVSAAVG